MIEVDINAWVYVRLSKTGKATYERHVHKERPVTAHVPPEDADEWCEMRLWELMHIFGPTLDIGTPPQFVSEIRITEHKEVDM